jgi:hypothetical protein
MSETLVPEFFLPHVNQAVHVEGWPHTLTLTAVEVRQREDWEKKIVPHQPFTVLFRGPSGAVLPEGFHAFQIAGGPSFKLYVMPIHTPQRDRQDYQAVFN